MKYARIINNRAVDISTDPTNQFHPDLAIEFVEVSADVERGWILTDGVWSAPPEPTPPPREWKQEDVRKHLTLSEKVSWDNDSTPEIVTAKNEFATGLEEAATIEVLDFLVSSNNISEASKTAVLA